MESDMEDRKVVLDKYEMMREQMRVVFHGCGRLMNCFIVIEDEECNLYTYRACRSCHPRTVRMIDSTKKRGSGYSYDAETILKMLNKEQNEFINQSKW